MNLFIISDTHFSHENMLIFRDESGRRVRPEFSTYPEMDEAMVERWNAVVRPQDHVYHLGDVALGRKHLEIVRRLNGHKRLVFGNHDIYDYTEYANVGFKKLMGMRVIDGFILTHVPVHEGSLGRFKANIHGHIHASKIPDSRYFNACVEHHNYTPIAFEDIKKTIKENGGSENIK